MVEFIRPDETLAMRNKVLREGRLSPEECRFDGDELEESVHLGYYTDERELAGVVSFHPCGRKGFAGTGYQLRGMAVLPEYRNKGIGNLMGNFGVLYLKGRKVTYVWCNARKVAYSFYLGLGFEFVSDEFDIPGIGPHRVMYLKIS